MPDKIQILLVEDDPDDVLFLRQALEKAAPGRVEIEVATDADAAEAALKRIANEARHASVPRLVMMDHRLPGRSGFEFLQWMRADPALCQFPVIILSGLNDPEEVERAHTLGANSYLSKDMDQDQLERVAAGLVAYAELIVPRAGVAAVGNEEVRVPPGGAGAGPRP